VRTCARNRRPPRRLGLLALLLASCATVHPVIMGQPLTVPLPRLDGSAFDWSETRGKVVVVDIWASWCGTCAASMPYFAELQKTLGDQGFLYVGIDVDADVRAGRAFLAATGPGLLSLADLEAPYVTGRFEIARLPTRVWLDRRGVVRAVQEGFAAGDEDQVRREADHLLREPGP